MVHALDRCVSTVARVGGFLITVFMVFWTIRVGIALLDHIVGLWMDGKL